MRIFALSMMFVCVFSVCNATAFRMGDQGSEVAEIQGQLANLGYDVAADGDFGPATVEAVKMFQSNQGLDADGLVGPSTYSALMGREMPQVSRSFNKICQTIFRCTLCIWWYFPKWSRLFWLCTLCICKCRNLPSTHCRCTV